MRLNGQQFLARGLAASGDIHARKAPAANADRAEAVKEVFRTSWDGYYEHAFPHDTLRPVTYSFEDDRNQWGVTAIDTLSTAIIMGETQTVEEILDFVPSIDFTTTKKVNESVSVFESNIRYLGGLLSGYDLLKGPFSDVVEDNDKVEILLEQAKSLADSLSIAFDTPSGVPEGDVALNPEPRQLAKGHNSIAGFGTLVLEWVHLSDLTGDDKYANLVLKAQDYLLNPTGSPEAWPGLVGYQVSTETGEFQDSDGGWGGGRDSFYEYLIKMYLYDPEEFDFYRERWILAADSTIKHLASHPSTREDITFLSDFSGQDLIRRSGHLASFAGGNFILGGILLNEQKYIDFGIELAESYYEAYLGTASGISPEGWAWIDSEDTNGSPPDDKADFYEKAGYWATSTPYILRPETMESIYHAYRVTGDTKYQDIAWDAFKRIRDLSRVGAGYSSVRDVTKEDGGGFSDFQESFWLAETLKYLYLIFGPESAVQLKREGNEFVYNTEAQPLRVRQ